jgi:YgiT-type zinc finger domain-containing protein
MNECLYCKGKLEKKSISRVQEYQGRWYLIENVPALICKQCGETYYTPETHDLVLRLVKAGARPVRTETLSVLDANAA